MDWQTTIRTAMGDLAKTRPVFHSEADFQHALAWALQDAGCAVRLEVPWRGDPPIPRIAIVVSKDGERAALQLEYWQKSASLVHEEEAFELVTEAAQDVVRYDFWKDVSRVERLVAGGDFGFGCVLVLTNDPSYWRPTRPGGIDEVFRIFEDHPPRRSMAWSRLDTGTSKGRKGTITLQADRRCEWSDYAKVGGQQLRWGWVPIRSATR